MTAPQRPSRFRGVRAWTRLSCPICMLALLVSGAVAAISIAAINLDRARTEQQAQLRANYLADLARQRTADLFSHIDGNLRDIAAAAGLAAHGVNGERLDSLLGRRRRAEPGLLALYVLGADGNLLAADVAPTLRSADLLPACLQDEKLAPGQMELKPAYIARTAAAAAVPVVCFAGAYRDAGFAGAVLAVLGEDLITRQFTGVLAGSPAVITLRDEAGRVLARAGGMQPPNEAGGPQQVRRIETPVAATIALGGAEQAVLAGWWARSALIGSSAVTVIAFIWLAALVARRCQRREALRLERLTALSQDLRGCVERETLTHRLVAVAADLAEVVEVPTPDESRPPNGMPERRLSLSVLRPDLVRIGAVTLQQRDGAPFSLSDLAVLRVLARITESAIQHANTLAAADEAARRLHEQLQYALQASDATLREMSDAAFVLDGVWHFATLNRKAERLFGEYGDDLRNRSIWQVFPELLGTTFEDECRRAAHEGHEVVFEWHWMRSDAWLLVRAFPRAEGLAIYLQDVSGLVAANEKLRQAAKMEAIGRLTGGIAHNFNNTLQVVLANIEVLELDPPASEEAAEVLAAIKRAAENARKMTGQLLVFAGRQQLSRKVVNVARLIGGLDALLRGTLGAVITLDIRYPDTLWTAHVDPAQLQDAIVNLAINARDAMPSGGRLTIEAANLPIRKPESDPFGELKPGNYVVISVSDTGRGIPKDMLGNVFEPFFSTKPSGRGTGLGLAMVYGFVNQSGGHVKITSEVGRGTTVRLYLPSAGESRGGHGEAVEPAWSAAAADLPGGDEDVLVVEDNEGVREVVRAELSRLGYRVTVAADGPAALEMVDRGLCPNLLLTDVQMPGGMDGVLLAEQVLTRLPETKILYMSGYVDNLTAYQQLLDPHTNLLRKPFTRAELAARVRAWLDRKREEPGQSSSAA